MRFARKRLPGLAVALFILQSSGMWYPPEEEESEVLTLDARAHVDQQRR
jgi:hypothetical protein